MVDESCVFCGKLPFRLAVWTTPGICPHCLEYLPSMSTSNLAVTLVKEIMKLREKLEEVCPRSE